MGLGSAAGADEDFVDSRDRAAGAGIKQQDLMKGQAQSGV